MKNTVSFKIGDDSYSFDTNLEKTGNIIREETLLNNEISIYMRNHKLQGLPHDIVIIDNQAKEILMSCKDFKEIGNLKEYNE